MKIYLIRHGETDSNKKGILMGQRIDEPLNEVGIKQAQSVAQELLQHEFNTVFSSPQKRAFQTAQAIVRDRHVQILIREQLKERDFGDLTGKTWEEIDVVVGGEPGATVRVDF